MTKLCTVKLEYNLIPTQSIVWVKPPDVIQIFHFFTNGYEFLIDFLHTYYTFLRTLDYKFLFNYLQLWRSYAILSATTSSHNNAQNVQNARVQTFA